MQQITKYKDEMGYYEYIIKTDEGKFKMLFGGNLDLYWTCNETIDDSDQIFYITKENYFLYRLFDELYENIKNNKIYYDKENYIKGDNTELFKDGKIDWYSDEFYEEIASRLVIEKENEKFKITFIKSKKDYEGLFRTYAVRFRNSGSRYKPFNASFMYMYNSLKEYNPEYQQIHMEEYLYNQKVLKK